MTHQIKKLSFVHIFPIARDDPRRSYEESFQLVEFAEQLGYDAVWIRQRHLQYATPGAAAVLAALSQRTTKIGLSTAVIVGEYENPFNLAESLAVADVLSGGRLRPGVSVHPPQPDNPLNDVLFGPGWREDDFSYNRIQKLLDYVSGRPLRDLSDIHRPNEPSHVPSQPDQAEAGQYLQTYLESERQEPHAAGLDQRFWYGAGSYRSVEWAAQAGLHLLVDNILSARDLTETRSFDEVQADQFQAYRDQLKPGFNGQIALGRVWAPTSHASPERKAKFDAFIDKRTARTRAPRELGGKLHLFRKDTGGSLDQILDDLGHDPSYEYADELAILLPFEFDYDDYRYILEETATVIAPALGWSPTR
ncbi:MAG: LLM class flavin-dependent oxidoreductase [Propionibacteriaceae bacterium]|jgi:alkanesulfonate monooxygenase SsuD/methylene tetrahydromethanopterin reductase-like flavin-dependent oxidoreductase (luciferase family)|nr:LLM class flavin-dependent oxidoreductase [Propionibacteriaceae bacterium]